MKGRLIDSPDFYPEQQMPYSLLRGKEYLIVAVEEFGYLIYNELNEINLAPIDKIEITDHTKLDFWEKDNSNVERLVPKEWHWENFLSINGEPLLEIWDYEIWSVTQFAKGFYHYNFPVFPTNYKRAIDVEYKIDIINAYLKMCAEFDCIDETDYYGEYTFSTHPKFDDTMASRGSTNYKVKLLTNTSNGFEVLSEILKGIGEILMNSKLVLTDRDFSNIRDRILLSIWALFGEKDFVIYELEYIGNNPDYHRDPYYLMEKNNLAFKISYHWYT